MRELLEKKLLTILQSKKNDEGFSLVELVIVIAVLAILSAVAIPAFQGVQARAKTSAVKNGLTNGIKECVVSSGLGESTQYLVSQAFQGNYQGYTVRPYGNGNPNLATTNCYSSEAIPIAAEASVLPWFTITYDPSNGQVQKACGLTGKVNPPGCKSNEAVPW